MAEHVVPRKTYVLVWVALMVLMILTALLSRINLGDASTVVALGIAGIKALLVVLYFMHLRYESSRISAVVLFAGLFWLGLLMALSMTDYLSRGAIGVPGH